MPTKDSRDESRPSEEAAKADSRSPSTPSAPGSEAGSSAHGARADRADEGGPRTGPVAVTGALRDGIGQARDRFSKVQETARERLHQVEESAREQLHRVEERRDQLTSKISEQAESLQARREQLTHRIVDGAKGAIPAIPTLPAIQDGQKKAIDELVSRARQTREDIERRVDEGLDRTLGLLNIPSRTQMEALESKLDELNKRIQNLQKVNKSVARAGTRKSKASRRSGGGKAASAS